MFCFFLCFLSDPAEGHELPASQPLSQFKPNSMPTVVRAHAVITLGDKHLQTVPFFFRCTLPSWLNVIELFSLCHR